MDAILYYICIPLGYLMKLCWQLVGNYGVAIILFTLIIKVLMFPTSLKQQESMAKQRKMTEKQQELQKKYGIKEVIMTHIEEDWGKSYDDYKRLEEEYVHVRFAYDGMEISLP